MTTARRRTLFAALSCMFIISVFYTIDFQESTTADPLVVTIPNPTSLSDLSITSDKPPRRTPHVPREYTQTLVVASTQKEDTSWIAKALPNIQHAIYVADDSNAPFHPPVNKGHETMMYLTYIIDHYHNLSDTTIFTHAERNSWHNNDLFEFDLARMISAVSNEHVQRVGYFNLRCHHESGCPDHIKPHDTGRSDKQEQKYFSEVWDQLHGPRAPPLPETLAVACCSQFAVSREAIEKVPWTRWIHYRDWLMDNPLPDSITGRIWEWTWHYVLTGSEILCPPIEQCYCDGYGICFRDEGEITSWLAMKEIQMLAKHMKAEMPKEGGEENGREDVQFHLDQRITRPLNKWLYEAQVRGKDPKTRAILSGRGDSWIEGDGY